jgi:hypothetical protein
MGSCRTCELNVNRRSTILMAQKSSLGQMNRLPNRRKWQNWGYFGWNISYQIGISANKSPNDSQLIKRLISISANFLNIDDNTGEVHSRSLQGENLRSDLNWLCLAVVLLNALLCERQLSPGWKPMIYDQGDDNVCALFSFCRYHF